MATNNERDCGDDDKRIVLSDRELDVIRLIVKGKKYRDIAVELSLGYETVKTYTARIRKKLNVHSKTEIATWYLLSVVGKCLPTDDEGNTDS